MGDASYGHQRNLRCNANRANGTTADNDFAGASPRHFGHISLGRPARHRCTNVNPGNWEAGPLKVESLFHLGPTTARLASIASYFAMQPETRAPRSNVPLLTCAERVGLNPYNTIPHAIIFLRPLSATAPESPTITCNLLQLTALNLQRQPFMASPAPVPPPRGDVSRAYTVVIPTILTVIIAAIMTVLRLYVRIHMLKRLEWDDLFHVLAMVSRLRDRDGGHWPAQDRR